MAWLLPKADATLLCCAGAGVMAKIVPTADSTREEWAHEMLDVTRTRAARSFLSTADLA
jgi:hypothetical protein